MSPPRLGGERSIEEILSLFLFPHALVVAGRSLPPPFDFPGAVIVASNKILFFFGLFRQLPARVRLFFAVPGFVGGTYHFSSPPPPLPSVYWAFSYSLFQTPYPTVSCVTAPQMSSIFSVWCPVFFLFLLLYAFTCFFCSFFLPRPTISSMSVPPP